YEIAAGSCDGAGLLFSRFLFLAGQPSPAGFCVREVSGPDRRFELRVLAARPESADVVADQDVPRLSADYAGSILPGPIPLDGLGAAPDDPSGVPLNLRLTATDGNTPEVSDRIDFTWRGEAFLVFGRPPSAAAPGDLTIECAAPGGTPVTLDGGAS